MAAALLVLALIGFGIVIPVLITGSVDARNSVDNSGIKLSAKAERGRIVFGQRCRSCHTLAAANAAGRVGPSLDEVLGGNPFPEQLLRSAINNGRAEGQGQMSANIVDGEEEEQVVAFLKEAAGKVSPEGGN